MSRIDIAVVGLSSRFILTDGPTEPSGVWLDVPKETLDELVSLTAASCRLQALLRMLYERGVDEEEYIHWHAVPGEEQLALFDL